MEAGRNGITANTPKNILFGAGTIHKGLKYTAGSGSDAGSWNYADTIVGATNGGSKLSIVPEMYDVPIDGANVVVKNLKVKTGEAATMEVNFAELTEEIIKAATIGETATTSDVPTHNLIKSKADIADGDYWENVAFVGRTLDGKNIMAILENALVTSGLEQEGKNKEGAVGTYTFTCHADDSGDTFDVLPWKIYYPKATI